MPYCYQCDKEVIYLFSDGRGKCCTRLTTEEVTGEHNMENVEYTVQVKFKYNEGWSKPYTYKSMKSYEKYDDVIVPTNDFYNIGKVFSCKESEEDDFQKGINYKYVISRIEVPEN